MSVSSSSTIPLASLPSIPSENDQLSVVIKGSSADGRTYTVYRKQSELHLLICSPESINTVDIIIDSYFERWRSLLPSIDEKIDHLKEREIAIEGGIYFRSPLICAYSLNADKELRLGRGKKDLYWELFDRSTKSFSWIYATNDAYDDYQRNTMQYEKNFQELTGLFENLKSVPSDQDELEQLIQSRLLRGIDLEERISNLKNFDVDQIEVIGDREDLKTVSLKKITKKSKFDESVIINKDNWAVTLVSIDMDCNGGAGNFFINAGHAEIFVESIEEGKSLIYQSDYVPNGQSKGLLGSGQGIVRSTEHTPETIEKLLSELKFKGMKTWLSRATAVRTMLNHIDWEVEQQDKGLSPVQFHLSGQPSLLNIPTRQEGINWNSQTGRPTQPREHFVNDVGIGQNCTTWAKNKLRLADIELEPSQVPWLYEKPEFYVNRIQDHRKARRCIIC